MEYLVALSLSCVVYIIIGNGCVGSGAFRDGSIGNGGVLVAIIFYVKSYPGKYVE